jgi:uncharacterized protein YbjT (DUF2867 family)
MILITGASGTVGRAVLNEVLKNGQALRAMYRTEEDARRAPVGVATVVADFASKDSLKTALEGVETVFLVCSPIPELTELENNVVDACRDSGVTHIVLNSAMGAADYPKSFPSWHRRVEDKLQASGLGYTILRPNGFMQNIVAFYAPSIRAQGSFYAAMGNAQISYIDVRDVACVAALALGSPATHAGKTYELNGPDAVACADIAERISQIANRQVTFVDIPEDVQRKSMLDLGMPAWQVQALLELQQYYKNGQGGQVTDVLQTLLGRPPVNVNQFLEEFKEQFRSQAAGA